MDQEIKPNAKVKDNYQRKVIIICLLLMVIAIFGFFIYKLLFGQDISQAKDMKDKLTDRLNDITNTKDANKVEAKQFFSEEKNWYDTKIEYPENNLLVKNSIFQIYNDFASETEILKYTDPTKARAALGLFSSDMKYAFDATYRISTSSDSKTYIYEIYNFTGGAHGSQNINAINFDLNGKEINIEQILPVKILSQISKIAKVQLQEEKKKRLKASGGVTDTEIKQMLKNDEILEEGIVPTRENYNIAWYEGDFLVIYFGQYQVASYAEGTFQVKIPKAEIKRLINE